MSDPSSAVPVPDVECRRLARVALVLRVVGIADCLAVVVAFLPWTVIEQIHSLVGAGELRQEPTVEYLVRSVSLLHAMFGALLVLLSCDVARYLDLIRSLAKLLCLVAILLAVVDLRAGLPFWWLTTQCGGLLCIGLYLLLSPGPHSRTQGSQSE